MSHALLTSQQDDVFALVGAAGFDPREFEWTIMAVAGRETAQTLQHSSGAFFQFHLADDRYHFGYCSPGRETREQEVGSEWGSWGELLPGVAAWLDYIQREVSAPNFWAQLDIERELIAAPPAATENTPFTAEEQAEIAARIEELKRYARQTYQLTAAQYEAIDARLDYLVDASTRAGRRDWQLLLIGALMGLALEAIIPPESVRGLMVLGLRGLAHLLGVDTPELPGGGGSPTELL